MRRMSPTTKSEGQMWDHVGFEVKHLQAFCNTLQANGVLFDNLYSGREDGTGVATLTDPWGARIELTEGLRDIVGEVHHRADPAHRGESS